MIKLIPPYIIKVKSFFWSPTVSGFTFFPFIFVKDPNNRTVVEHEKIHIRQQLRGLLVIFYIRYLYYQWRYGYKKNPYEVEAFEHQDDWIKDDDII